MIGTNNKKQFDINIIDEIHYQVDSIDNLNSYEQIYFGDDAKKYPTSKHGITISQFGKLINKCLIVGSGGATTIHDNSSIRDKNQILICCCNSVFCLSIPDLTLNWVKVIDCATCFQIFKHNDYYFVHGELQITKLDYNGEIMWQFGGKDIFVSLDDQKEFKIEEDGILLYDFGNTSYKIDFDGNLIWTKN